MKKLILLVLMIATGLGLTYAVAQSEPKRANIEFATTSHNFGSFPESDPVVSCEFAFTNTGDAPLIIHQVLSSCGCTVPSYTKDPIMAGEKGVIKVTYNGTGKFLGKFRKTVTVRSNARKELVRLIIEGEMKAADTKKK